MIKATISTASCQGALTIWPSPGRGTCPLLGQVISSSRPGLFLTFHSTTPACREPVGPSPLQLSLPWGFRGNLSIPYPFSSFLLAWGSFCIRTDNRFSCAFTNPKSICLLAHGTVGCSSGGSQQSHPCGTSIPFCHKGQQRLLLAVVATRQMTRHAGQGSPSACDFSHRREQGHERFEEAEIAKDIFNS